MAHDLEDFVAQALGKGLARPEIEAKLIEAGWPADDVREALAAYADIDFPVPIPRPRPYLQARDAFVYLVLFSMLYTSAIAWIQLLFALIHHAFPDPAAVGGFAGRESSTIRWFTACILVAFPIFLALSRRTYAALRANPEKRRSRIRKWLTYLTLFAAAATLVCDVITLVYYLLGGELTVRFLLKVAAVGTVAGAVLGFYLWHLRQDDLDPSELPATHRGVRALVALLVAAILASVAGGLVVAGSPTSARTAALDRQRVEDLSSIANAIDQAWRELGTLPATLEELARRRGVFVRSIADPETGAPYEYRSTGERRYELCATFGGASATERKPPYPDDARYWAHEAGRHCFDVAVSSAP